MHGKLTILQYKIKIKKLKNAKPELCSPSPQPGWSQEVNLETYCFLLLPLEVTLWSPGTTSRSRQGWRKWWAAHSQKLLVRKAIRTDVTRRDKHSYHELILESEASVQTVTAQKEWKAVPLRGSLLLIKRHWSLLLSTERHIIQQHSN